MKLSDEKLDALLRPLVAEHILADNLLRFEVKGRLDASYDEAIFITVEVKDASKDSFSQIRSSLDKKLHNKIEEIDERQYVYINFKADKYPKPTYKNADELSQIFLKEAGLTP